ncbi:protein AMBP-like isoform X1 [Scomber japonicus]|uniref:protein AMBP-like isoform X1 n=1 Tax=Scomber japonicus TaxID=13676 RepID=UPI002305BBC6|nr:protein AMBP-like isoform X1 [Scomber japonicus]XP_053195614.1 protein AMBP-like isoform X1 [Scomber japonicus]XP_053195615.1 protein AMBP-like isoform X1 [Scomber japonicus]
MQRAVVSLLVLQWAWTLKGIPVLPETYILAQENFDLGQFMGKWYEVAVVSTCPYYMQRKRGNPVIVTLELKHVASQDNFTMTATNLRNDSCIQTSTVYSLTNTPGRFFHHVARFGADVDSFVVHTNYDEFAMMVLLGTERPAEIKTTTVKLYSRSMVVKDAVLDDFKTLARQQGMSDDTIINNQNKGECTPSEPVTEPTPKSQV